MTTTNEPSTSSSARPKASIPIRPGTIEDAAAISQLIGSTWAQHFGYSVSPSDLETYLATKLSVGGIEKDFANPNNVFLVATSPASSSSSALTSTTDQILGVVQLVQNSHEPFLTLPNPLELQRLYVDSAAHGTGLGAQLISAAEEYGRQAGYASLWLGVWEDNLRAKRFYEKMGFAECGEHYFFVGQSKRRDLVLEKAI